MKKLFMTMALVAAVFTLGSCEKDKDIDSGSSSNFITVGSEKKAISKVEFYACENGGPTNIYVFTGASESDGFYAEIDIKEDELGGKITKATPITSDDDFEFKITDNNAYTRIAGLCAALIPGDPDTFEVMSSYSGAPLDEDFELTVTLNKSTRAITINGKFAGASIAYSGTATEKQGK